MSVPSPCSSSNAFSDARGGGGVGRTGVGGTSAATAATGTGGDAGISTLRFHRVSGPVAPSAEAVANMSPMTAAAMAC